MSNTNNFFTAAQNKFQELGQTAKSPKSQGKHKLTATVGQIIRYPHAFLVAGTVALF